MKLSLIKAAEASGKSKSTINRAIKSGKLSAHRNDNGSYDIDPSELARVFPKAPLGTPSTEPITNSSEPLKVKELELRLQAADERLQEARDRILEKDDIISDLKSDRDTWRQQATMLLQDHRQDMIKSRPSVWKRLFRTASKQ